MELARLPRIKVNSTLNQQAMTDEDLEAPIMGYEIRQPRTRHTVYKIYVHYTEKQGWLVYRRYREFHKLRADLKKLFPAKEFTLPPKRYFGDNFEPRFLSNRRQGLQGFLYMITRQRDVLRSPPVSTFLMLDHPPSVVDDLEQCQGIIEQLKSTVEKLKTEKSEQHASLTSSNTQIVELHDQKQAVLAALRYERQQNGRKYYHGDDLSLMFEYRSLPEVCRVDVSSFLVRKPPAYLARKLEDKSRKLEDKPRKLEDKPRKFDDKSRKFEDKIRKFDDKARKPDDKPRKNEEKSRKDETSRDLDHYSPRPRPFTPPHGRSDMQKDRQRTALTKSQPQIEINPAPNAKEKKKAESKSTASEGGEFQSFYDLDIRRRKSMPGAVEWHRVNNMLKAKNYMSEAVKRQTSLVVPDTSRPRSYSATPAIPENRTETRVNSNEGCRDQVQRQASLGSPKKNISWSSLKDLRKLKVKD